MKEKKWTQGPWKSYERANGNFKIDSLNIDDGSSSVCDISHLWIKKSRQQANAHLISAAPTLLESLVIARGCILEICSVRNIPVPSSTIRRIESAISEAYGDN